MTVALQALIMGMAAARGRERLSGAVQLPEPNLTINSRPEIRLAKRRPQCLAHSRCSKRTAGAHQHGDGGGTRYVRSRRSISKLGVRALWRQLARPLTPVAGMRSCA